MNSKNITYIIYAHIGSHRSFLLGAKISLKLAGFVCPILAPMSTDRDVASTFPQQNGSHVQLSKLILYKCQIFIAIALHANVLRMHLNTLSIVSQ